MFTGIITEIGRVKSIVKTASGARLEVECENARKNLKIGSSVAVNGACLSAVNTKGRIFFDIVTNTLNKTTLKQLKTGDPVNLENALRAGDSLSGHLVSGHVDCQRRIKDIAKTSGGPKIDIEILPEDKRYLVSKGSVAIDGISLTVGDIYRDFFRVYLIPHTVDNTTLKFKKTGTYVNVEFDMFAKYAEKYTTGSHITKEMLEEKGF